MPNDTVAATPARAKKAAPKTPSKRASAKAPGTPGHVTTVEAAAAEAEASRGPTVMLRAIARGQYGLAGVAARVIDPPEEFPMAIKDLVPFKGGEWHDGSPREAITINDKEYTLPSWCEDGRNPADVEADEPVAVGAARSSNDSVI